MSNNDNLKESATEIVTELAKDVYVDAVQPAAKNVGGILDTITGFFNYVVMYPLRSLNSIFEQKAINLKKRVDKKCSTIPEEQLVEPQLHIVGPAMEALKFNIMEDDLAEMFANLLVSNVDAKVQHLCTPAFIRIIEQLSPNDAKLFNVFYNKGDCAICTIKYNNKKDKNYILNNKYVPQYFINMEGIDFDVFDVSRSINNLERLGLVDVSFINRFIDINEYVNIFNTTVVKEIAEKAKEITGCDYYPKIDLMGVMNCSDFSKAFAKVCLRR